MMGVTQTKIRRILLFGFLLTGAMASAGPIVLKMGSGGNFAVGTKTDRDAMHGTALNLGSISSGKNSVQIFNGHLFFNTEFSIQGRNAFYAPGQQLMVTGWMDLNHDGIARDRGDLWGVLVAAKLLNPHLVDRGGQIYFVSRVLETINPKLAALLGLRDTTRYATLELQLLRIKMGNQVHDVIEGGTLTTGAVPEPASIVLLGAPLLWFGARWLRRLS